MKQRELSYGGAVVRRDAGEWVVCLIQPANTRRWTLPKGGAEQDESSEKAALREIREETGIEAKIIGLLGNTDYRYRRDGRLRDKTVHYFLCEYVSGSTKDHDDEVEKVEWLLLDDALKRMTYPAERKLLADASAKLSSEV